MSCDLDISQISPRARECLALVAYGLESKHIAAILHIEPGSVDVTLKRASRRTGVRGRKQLASYLRQQHPEVIQSTIQRLGHSEKSLANMILATATDAAGTSDGWRPWKDQPPWRKRLLATAIMISTLIAALLLVKLSNHVLMSIPRPESIGLGER